ncbi:MAG: GIY-YIG nuclease family protein [Candidatus Doudnabacteria bacterium]
MRRILFNRVKLRLKQHQQKEVKSTENRGSFQLIYFEGCLNQQDATHREKYLKTYLGKMFLGNRLKSYLTGSTLLNNFVRTKLLPRSI